MSLYSTRLDMDDIAEAGTQTTPSNRERKEMTQAILLKANSTKRVELEENKLKLIHATQLKLFISQRAASILLGKVLAETWWPWYQAPLIDMYEARFGVIIAVTRKDENMEEVVVNQKGNT
jgi:hypothetical protein